MLRRMTTHADDLLQLAERIVAARAEVAKLEGAFHALVGATAPARPATNVPVPAPVKGSIADRLKAAVRTDPVRIFTLVDFFAALPDADPKSVRGTLGRLAGEQDGLLRVERGKYRFFAGRSSAHAEASAANH